MRIDCPAKSLKKGESRVPIADGFTREGDIAIELFLQASAERGAKPFLETFGIIPAVDTTLPQVKLGLLADARDMNEGPLQHRCKILLQ